MRKTGGGSIVFNGSAIAHRGYANHDVMAAAKGAVAGQPALIASLLMVPVLIPVNAPLVLHVNVGHRQVVIAQRPCVGMLNC